MDQIKKLQPKDASAYRAIRLESLLTFPNSFCSVYEEQKEKEKLGFEKDIEQGLNHKFVIGAFHNSNLIGICAFFQYPDNPKSGELVQMYVQNNYQGQGMGLQLINELLAEAKKTPTIETVFLEVRYGIDNALHLYKKAGFSPINQPKSEDEDYKMSISI